jgi:hypothetical protein
VDKRYLNAFLAPPKFTIGGIELDYFCARHFITLQMINSPFINPNAKGLNGKDLFTALRVCSTKSWLDSLNKLTLVERWRYLLIDSIPENQSKALMMFGDYLSQSMSVPKIWVKADDKKEPAKPTNIPETLSMVVILMTKFGFSEEEAWNMPFSRAIWYATAFSAQEGAEISIITTESEEKEKEDLTKLEEFEKRISQSVKVNRKKNKK